MDYLQIANSSILCIAVSVLLFVVLLQTIFMLRKGWKEAIRLGVSKETLMFVAKNSIGITIVPTIPIVISLFLLVPLLGKFIPWLRLSVIGSSMFEMIAAEMGAQAAGAPGLVAQGFTKEAFVNAVWCMSLGGSMSLLFSLVALKPVSKMYDKMKNKDTKWIQILGSIAMLALIVSFAVDKASLSITSALVVIGSIVFTVICIIIAKKYKIKALNDFILPISIIFGLFLSYFIGNWII